MTKVQMRTGVYVDLIRAAASDLDVIQAARVSVKGKNVAVNADEHAGMINYLMKSRHGSPFEHNSFTFFVEAPIFVFREWHRHRIGSSINEMSGRYTKMVPKFYTPAFGRGLINAGSSAHPDFVATKTPRHIEIEKRKIDTFSSQTAWDLYEEQLDLGVAKEAARTILPLNIYSQMFWTANARSIMNFLSLRVDSSDATYPSKPQWEIQLGASAMEKMFAEAMPITHAAFVRNGRVAP